MLSQVRDFTFSPDDGRIDSIKYDRFGLPALSDNLVSVSALPVWEVLRVESTRLLIRSNPQYSKETDGLLDRATRALLPVSCSCHQKAPRNASPHWRLPVCLLVSLMALTQLVPRLRRREQNRWTPNVKNGSGYMVKPIVLIMARLSRKAGHDAPDRSCGLTYCVLCVLADGAHATLLRAQRHFSYRRAKIGSQSGRS